MNIEYVEEKDISVLVSNIGENYSECNKYDAYIEKEREEEIDDDQNEKDARGEIREKGWKNEGDGLADKKMLGGNQFSCKGKKNEVDNIMNAIFKKKPPSSHDKHSDKKNWSNSPKGNNKNVFTNLRVRKKRIMESSDESDENENVTTVKRIMDDVKKRRNKRK
ncbi:conserved Plasmodium protein, unknown function [Plasmodium ovale]|uniref:Uncharacterized protein n=2 Tax=Plasmodium ovale TaxID=36330 RepID=A0A1A8W2H2_PLAOA|nr:conserved Plasmodium protein, unknown function [Plasmodium ovale curtisi]SBS97299.1 conserved Plasmodium protein, unknown function [Plasmodium ovale curtisi]SCP05961.1 conserved Plasmodium protein, unknown function [Plasmodium ovale]